MNTKVERLKQRIANRRSRHVNTADLERELVREVVKQIRKETRAEKQKRAA